MLNTNFFIQAIDQNYLTIPRKDVDLSSDDDINSQIYKEAEVYLMDSLWEEKESNLFKLTNYLNQTWKKQLCNLKDLVYCYGK